MNVTYYHIEDLKAGTFLLSEPFMQDFHFKRTVILIAEFNDLGSIGFILNRKSPNFTVSDILPEFDTIDKFQNWPLFLGGPVNSDIVFYVHKNPDLISESIPLTQNIYWGGSFEDVKENLLNGNLSQENIQFFIGYSGWDKEQLIDELKTNSWITNQYNSNFIFDHDTESLWKRIIKSKGGDFEFLANYPELPILN